ncbi:MAG: aldo/keto reductase [Acidobacteria bacterium]|nr:aldo/keto reductase [Acidobacteriota bacterium]
MIESPAVPRVELAPGYTISRLIKGGWQLAGGHGAVEREAALDDMFRFVDTGITTFDSADIYTGVESLIGEFLRRLRARDGARAEGRVQVHTKYVPDRTTLARLTRRDVEDAIDRSLSRLGVDTLDLVQFHWWDLDVPGWVETAQWLDGVRRTGKVRHVGLTNFDVPRVETIVGAGVQVVSHQVQYSVLDRRPERGVAAACEARGVSLLTYGALAGGFLSERWLGHADPVPPLENRSLVKYRLIVDEFGGWEALQRVLLALDTVARRHGCAMGTVALRWVLERRAVAAAIVGARHAGHLDATCRAAWLPLDAADLAEIDDAAAGAPGPAGDVYALEREKGGRHAAIMRYDLNARQ